MVIAQANAQWRQNVSTVNTASQNEANMQDAKAANAFTASTLDQVWQRERDLMSFAWKSGETALERVNAVVLQNISATSSANTSAAQISQAKSSSDTESYATIGSALIGIWG